MMVSLGETPPAPLHNPKGHTMSAATAKTEVDGAKVPQTSPLPPVADTTATVTVDPSGQTVKAPSILLTTIPSTPENVKGAGDLLITRMFEAGKAVHESERASDTAARQMLALRRTFSKAITIDKVEIIIPDLTGQTGSYGTEMTKVSQAAAEKLREEFTAMGLPLDAAMTLATERVTKAHNNAKAALRRIVEVELTVEELKLHGFSWSSAIGKGNKLPKPEAKKAQQRITTAVKNSTDEVLGNIGRITDVINGEDPHAIVNALLPILHTVSQQLLPQDVKANVKAVEATYRDLVATVEMIGLK